MKNKITIFAGKGTNHLKAIIEDCAFAVEFNYEKWENTPPITEPFFALYCLGKNCGARIFKYIKGGEGNGEFDPIFFEDFLSRIDEAIDLKPYFEELLDADAEIFYFAEHESSIERLRKYGLPLEIYRKSKS